MRTPLILGLVACLFAPGAGEVRRLALLIGVNEGLEDDTPLRYAAKDARELAAVLGRHGDFGKADVRLRTDIGLQEARAELRALSEAVRAAKRAGSQTLVLLFYSGHGDSGSLHIRGGRLPRSEIAGYLQGLESDLKIVILDACESGDFLRKKGGRFLDDREIRIEKGLEGKGTVFLSSSSPGEWSQESEEYGGGIFSHHLMNGLRGLADRNGDNNITLMEAFDYARASTQMEKAAGKGQEQNPAFDFDLVGLEDPVLTRLGTESARLRLSGIPLGPVYVYQGEAATKVWVMGEKPASYAIPGGKYLLRVDGKNVVYLKPVVLATGGESAVDFRDFREQPAASFRRKGPAAFAGSPHGFRVDASHTRIASWLETPVFSLDYTLRFARLYSQTGVGYGRKGLAASGLRSDFAVWRFRQAVAVPFFKSRIGQARAGMAGDWLHVRQSIEDTRFPDGPVETEEGAVDLKRESGADFLRLSLPLEYEVYFAGPLCANIGVAGVFSRSLGPEGENDLFSWQPSAGIGFRF